jgi:hypothetical protein
MIILIVILLVLLWFLLNKKNNQPPITTIINTIEQPVNIYKNKKKKRIYIPFKHYYDNKPAFRGLVHKYQTLDKDEYGGSKPFKYKKLDNTNLNNNHVKYNKYNSYRIKPITKKDLDK